MQAGAVADSGRCCTSPPAETCDRRHPAIERVDPARPITLRGGFRMPERRQSTPMEFSGGAPSLPAIERLVPAPPLTLTDGFGLPEGPESTPMEFSGGTAGAAHIHYLDLIRIDLRA